MAEHNRNREQQAAERAAALGAFGEGFKAGADPMRGRRGRALDQDPERHRHFRAGFEAGRRAAEQATIDYRAKLLALASSPPAPDPEAAALAAGLAAGLVAPSTPSGRQADEETGPTDALGELFPAVSPPPADRGCRRCGRPTFGPLCAACKGEPR